MNDNQANARRTARKYQKLVADRLRQRLAVEGVEQRADAPLQVIDETLLLRLEWFLSAVVKPACRGAYGSDLLKLLKLSRNDLENGAELLWNVAAVTRRCMEHVNFAHA